MRRFKKTSALLSIILVLAIIAGLFTSCSGNSGEDYEDYEDEYYESYEDELAAAESDEIEPMPEEESQNEHEENPETDVPVADEPAVEDAEYYRNLPTLDATDAELDSLCQILILFEEYDCDSEDALKLALINLIGMYGNINLYLNGMNAYSERNEPISGQDPLGKFAEDKYYEYPAETVDELLRSAYNVEPDHDYAAAGVTGNLDPYYNPSCIYYYDGCYYSRFCEGGGAGNLSVTDVIQNNGKYFITVAFVDFGEDGERIGDPAIEVTAKLFDFDGIRMWSFEKVDFLKR